MIVPAVEVSALIVSARSAFGVAGAGVETVVVVGGGGGGALTVAVTAEDRLAVPKPFVAVSVTRMVEPTSAALGA